MKRIGDLRKHIAERVVTPRPDCMIWTAATDRGYGRVSVDGVVKRVHRVAWELAHGPIPEGMTVDHLCKVKSCINVEHLELVTDLENKRRGARDFKERRQGYPREKRTHCSEGHELTPENGYSPPTDPDHVRCRTCSAARRRKGNAA